LGSEVKKKKRRERKPGTSDSLPSPQHKPWSGQPRARRRNITSRKTARNALFSIYGKSNHIKENES
jgi:hypothetical protein